MGTKGTHDANAISPVMKQIASIDHHSIKTILVIRQHNQLGDMLCAVPALRALQESFPAAHIRFVLSPLHHDIINGCPFIDEILNYDKTNFFNHPRRFFSFARLLRIPHPDIAIVISTVSSSFTSNAMAWISGAPIRIGPASIADQTKGSRQFFTHPLVLDWTNTPRRHQIERNLDTVRFLGADTKDFSIDIGLTDIEKQFAREFFTQNKGSAQRVVGFHPGAGKVQNRWSASFFANVANTLGKRFKAHIMITAGPMDDEPVAAMIKELIVPFTIVKGRTIREVAAIIDQMSLYITNDTGTMHVAAATNARILSLFGPTNPYEWAPLGERNRFLRGKGGDIDLIKVDRVIETAMEMLKKH
ncbi:MAG: glycosyltransferase family 9 protein [Bacteroidota bacterium]